MQYDDAAFFSPVSEEQVTKVENTPLNRTLKGEDKNKSLSTRTSMIGDDEVDMQAFMNYQ